MSANETMTDAELLALYRKGPETISITETAKIIRAELKKAFPAIKFSVRCSVYSMGSHVNVSYADGPPCSAIEAITDQFYGRGFDGMTDSTTYRDADYQGRRVHFSGSRPSVRRDISNHDELMTRIKAALAKQALENPYNHCFEWMVLGSMDLRWETPERAVLRCVSTDRMFT